MFLKLILNSQFCYKLSLLNDSCLVSEVTTTLKKYLYNRSLPLEPALESLVTFGCFTTGGCSRLLQCPITAICMLHSQLLTRSVEKLAKSQSCDVSFCDRVACPNYGYLLRTIYTLLLSHCLPQSSSQLPLTRNDLLRGTIKVINSFKTLITVAVFKPKH